MGEIETLSLVLQIQICNRVFDLELLCRYFAIRIHPNSPSWVILVNHYTGCVLPLRLPGA